MRSDEPIKIWSTIVNGVGQRSMINSHITSCLLATSTDVARKYCQSPVGIVAGHGPKKPGN